MPKNKMEYAIFKAGIHRFQAAMQGRAAAVPVYAQLHDFARKENRISAREFYTNPEILVKSTLETIRHWDLDLPLIDFDVYNIEAEALGQNIIYGDDAIPDIDRSKPLIRSTTDLEKIKTPDFNKDGRFYMVRRIYDIFRDLTGLEPDLQFTAPFSLAANIRGIENLIFDIMEQPEFARALLERVTETVLIPWVQCLQKAFPDAGTICGADAMSSIPIINMEMLRNWSAPYILKIRKACGDQVYVSNWVGEQWLKDPAEMFALKLAVCPNFLQGQDPDVSAIGPDVYKAYAEEKGVPLILGVGAAFLALSTPKEIDLRVRHYIDRGAKNGRLGLYLCNVDSSTPPENLKAAIAAVRRYGEA